MQNKILWLLLSASIHGSMLIFLYTLNGDIPEQNSVVQVAAVSFNNSKDTHKHHSNNGLTHTEKKGRQDNKIKEKKSAYDSNALTQLSHAIKNTIVYPPRAVAMRAQGTVIIRVKIDSAGQPVLTTVTSSSGYQDLDHAALEAVKRWSYKQGEASQFELEFNFILK